MLYIYTYDRKYDSLLLFSKYGNKFSETCLQRPLIKKKMSTFKDPYVSTSF